MAEVWKEIDGFPGYEISSKGNVRCFRNFHGNITDECRYLKPLLNKDDYYYVDLYTMDRKPVHKRIHRLVADAFLGKHDDLVVNHIDGNKHNNTYKNLEWVTSEENSRHASETGLYKTKPIRIIETGEKFRSIKECANRIGSHPSDISHYFAGRNDLVKGFHFEYISEEEYQKKEKAPFLYPYQMDAVKRMKNGCILNGGVGSGKSRTGLYYYFKEQGGSIDPDYIPMKNPKDLYIITTAQKRDNLEFEGELSHFLLSTHPDANYYKNKVMVDSWNNIQKYKDIQGAFFILDEQRVCGSGTWVKSFLKIAKNNDWILLSATAGDTWMDFVPVFIANGFFKNRTEFIRNHVIYNNFSKYPKIDRYVGTGKLLRLKNSILVDMDFSRHTIAHHEDIYVKYNIDKYKAAGKTRWNPYKDEPIRDASGLCYVWRRIVNSDESRQVALLEIFEDHPKMIIFYSFDYELDILRSLFEPCKDVVVGEYNGHKHDPLPDGPSWVYLVNYNAGNAGWNCITTNCIVFFSQNYSYKIMQQAAGRIDRLNTPYTDLYYYHLKSRSGIDLAISKALSQKKNFNEGRFVNW